MNDTKLYQEIIKETDIKAAAIMGILIKEAKKQKANIFNLCQSEIAKDLDISIHTVYRKLKDLERMGYLNHKAVIIKKFFKSNIAGIEDGYYNAMSTEFELKEKALKYLK